VHKRECNTGNRSVPLWRLTACCEGRILILFSSAIAKAIPSEKITKLRPSRGAFNHQWELNGYVTEKVEKAIVSFLLEM
jgi:hypothetical protein